jgi:glycosyltransferase involved in cell wall biosynthesis
MKKEKAFLFVGGVYPEERIEEILSKCKSNPQMAANSFQWGLIHGFDEALSSPVTIMNEMFIGSYPKNYKDPLIFTSRFSHADNSNDINLGFINICYLKQFMKPFGETRFLKKWLRINENCNVFIYALSIRTIRIAKSIKKISKKAKIMVSVNDLPQHVMYSKRGNPLASIWRNYQTKTIYNGLKYIDGFMIVAEHQRDVLNLQKEKCVLVEAITDKLYYTFYPYICESSPIIKNIVYTGTLALQYNIMNLVNAFTQIDDENIRLIICGDGEAKDEILRFSTLDKRIVYMGVLPKDKIYEILRSAWVLVNPRQSGQSFTDYSFPIKTIDYLAAGRPVICQRLEAIPKEYDDHLIYFERDDNDKGLVEKLKFVLQMSVQEIDAIGKANVQFVNDNKTPHIQTNRILDLFDKI